MVTAATPEPTARYDIAAALLEAAAAELDLFAGAGLGQGAPDRRCVYPGAELPWDNCDCGLLAVHIKTTYPSESFPFQLGGQGASVSCKVPWTVVAYAVTILRCTPGMDDAGRPPPCPELDAAARLDFLDRSAVWRGVACYLATPINPGGDTRPHLLQEQLSIGDQGQCAGSELNVLVGLANCVRC